MTTPTVLRVLVVDDSVVIRLVLSELIEADPELTLAGAAPDGAAALSMIPRVRPDVVVLDVDMPVLDGLGTLRRMREVAPDLPVVMFSTLTERGASTTLEALALGASDYLAKPSRTAGIEPGKDRIRRELLPRLKALGRRRSAPSGRPATPQPAPPVAAHGPVEVVAIGASTGGPNAISTVLSAAAGWSVPVLIVQHMPPVFTRMFAERLGQTHGLRVAEGEAGASVRPGAVWIAPGDRHMGVERSGASVELRVHEEPPENFCRPSVDVLFRSVAEVYGPHALAIVLTGMGEDGLRGAQAVRRAGGRVWAQDEATSVVWAMPGAVARAGTAERVLPIAELGPEIGRLLWLGRQAGTAR